MTRVIKKTSVLAASMLLPLALFVGSASATTSTWTGTGDGTVGDAQNWGGSALVGGYTAVFPVTGLYQNVDFGSSSYSLDSIIFTGDNDGSSSKSYTLDGTGTLTLDNGIAATMTGSGGDHQVNMNVSLGADQTFSTGGASTLTVGNTGTKLDLGDGLATYDLTLDASGGSIVISGNIAGTGNIIKKGSGKVVFNAGQENEGEFLGALTVEDGDYIADGATGSTNVSIAGGTLKGTGTVGNVTMSAGMVAPGQSPGVISTGDLTYTGGEHEVELGGTADGEYDQVNVTGAVDLGSATDLTITLVNGYEPEVNDVFFIIQNDDTDAIEGAFNGMANGDKVTLGEYTYQINYDAGDGNDVALLVTGTPSAPDTGVETVMQSPIAAFIALAASFGVLGTLRYADAKRK